MSRDRWEGLLAGQPLLDGLARLAARRRHARERSEEDDEFEALEEVESPIRLAAADGEHTYRDSVYSVVVGGGFATQTAGPGGLTIQVGEVRVALAPGVPVPVPPVGDVLLGLDARGRSVRLVR
ncbi:hypothetical protein LBMAG42_21960 [Deltaproteobacteria bacterium]|nr:hypothetical protein LBMAG42_21960 [Deltaproteobacteria bacterium]